MMFHSGRTEAAIVPVEGGIFKKIIDLFGDAKMTKWISMIVLISQKLCVKFCYG